MKKVFVIPLALALITPIKFNAKEFMAITYDGASYVTHNKAHVPLDIYSPDKALKKRHIHKFYKANKDGADFYIISWALNGKFGSKIDISLKDGKLDVYTYDIRDAKLEKKDSFTEKDTTTLVNEFYKKYVNKDGELKISEKNKSIEFKGSEGFLIYVDMEYGNICQVTTNIKL